MEQLWNLFGEFLMQIFIALGTIALGIGITWMKKNTTIQQRNLIEAVVAEGVKYAQQQYGDKPGEVRLQEALKAIVLELEKVGIKNIDQEQLNVHVHAVLKELKKEFGDQWKETQE